MHVHLPRERHPCGEQQGRPQDAVEAADVLADQMERIRDLRGGGARPCRARPPLPVQERELVLARRPGTAGLALARQPPQRVAALGPADRRQVVEQRVRPHVGGVPGSARDLLGKWNPPRQVRSRHAHVLEPFADDVRDLVAPVVGLDELGVGFEVLEQRLVVLGEAEEEVGLAHLARFLLVLRTAPLLVEILLQLERLAALAVEPLVLLLEQRRLAALGSAGFVQAAEELLDRQLVARLRGPDEAIVGDSEGLPGRLELRRQLVHEHAGRLAGGFGRAGDLLPVLVGPGQKVGGIAALAVKTRQRVGDYLLVGMPQVGPPVHVVNRGRDVETRGHWSPGSEASGEYRPSVQRPSRLLKKPDCCVAQSLLAFRLFQQPAN